MTDLRRVGRWIQLVSVGALALFLIASAVAAPSPTAAPQETRDSRVLLGAMGAGYDGGVYELRRNGSTAWSYTANGISYTDVSRTPSGNVLAGYQNKDGANVTTGVRIIDPEAGRVVWSYSFAVETALNSEVHDAERLPNGNVVIADMDRERVFIVNRSTRAIEWQWNASSHYREPAEGARSRDWLHINDVDRIGSGRFLVSVRNANQLLILDRGQGVVEVVNEINYPPEGGAPCRGARNNQLVGSQPKCGDSDVLDHQHNPQWLGDGRILVADSENDRVVELQRSGGRWEVAWADYHANGLAYDWPRDADRLANGNTLILDTRNRRLVEIAPNGSTVWATRIPAQGYDADAAGRELAGNGSLRHYTDAESEPKPPDVPVVLIDIGWGTIQHLAGQWLPAWLTEWHLFAAILTANGVGVGVLVDLAGRWRDDTDEVAVGWATALRILWEGWMEK